LSSALRPRFSLLKSAFSLAMRFWSIVRRATTFISSRSNGFST
jgi:hypothetical protein